MTKKDEINFEKIKSEEEDRKADTALYKIITYGTDMTLELLSKKLEDKEITIPPFQRRYVWTPKKASKLIESFLLGLPVPQIFLYRETGNQELLVVDGQQRLKSILFFFEGKFEDGKSFFLRDVKSRWEGKTYKDLEESDKRRFKNSILRSTIFEQTDPKDHSSIFEIFERLNTGGISLTPQEIRNCVVQGTINSFLIQLNEHPSWRNLLGKIQPDLRMRDIEMILRFFALYEKRETYKKPMKDFISDFMKEKKNLSEKEQENYSNLFKKITDYINHQIGANAFKIKAGINIAVFDSVSVALAIVGIDNVHDFKQKYTLLLNNEAYKETISKSTTDTDRVKSRIKIAIETFSK